MSLSDLLLRYIKENNLTYESFAQRCNLSKGYVSMLINNKNPKTGKPPVPTIETNNITSQCKNQKTPYSPIWGVG